LGFLRRLRLDDEQLETPVAIVTGDYFLDDHVWAELKALGAVLYFKPLWLEDWAHWRTSSFGGATPRNQNARP
jgi:hypothetical protein